jgi:hypothetical protein
MQLPEHTLPLATTAAFTPGDKRPAANRTGWASALARASSSAAGGKVDPRAAEPPHRLVWPQPAGHVPLVGDGASTRRKVDIRIGSQPSPLACGGVQFHSWSDPAISAPVGIALAAPHATCPAVSAAEPLDATTPAWLPRGGSNSADRGAIRVHLEQRVDGLAIWFGVDAHPEVLASRMAAVLSELRRNLRGASQIASAVCNGTPIYPATPRLPKEPP